MNYFSFFTNRKIFIISLLGFASGLPLALTSSTLQAWFSVTGADIVLIGFISWVGLPYVYKFLWAPLLDRFVPPWLGRRRGWMLITQLLLILALASMALLNPVDSPWGLLLIAFFVAFLSASQDVAIDAYRTDILLAEERGLGTAMTVLGYRIAMLISGALALLIANYWGWHLMYLTMAALMAIGLMATYLAVEPQLAVKRPSTLRAAILEPFKEFLSREQGWLLLIFIVLYKLGDAFAGSLTIAFLLKGVGFSLVNVGLINKTVGLGATLIGVLAAGIIMLKMSLWRSLFYFGLLQAVSNLMLVLLAMVGKNYALMVSAIFIENFCGGLGTAAFTAFLMSLCHSAYTATQFALLSSLSAIGRVFIGPLAGTMVAWVGWTTFFSWSLLLAIPGLWLLYYLRKSINNHDPQLKIVKIV